MSSLSDYDLYFVGRSVDAIDGAYYMSDSHWNLLREMATEFGDATYLCQSRSGGSVDGKARIDESIVDVVPNETWGESRPPEQLWSLRREIRELRRADPYVAYVYYPGFYSFLLSPFAVRNAALSVAHFGSDANDTARAAYERSVGGAAKAATYRLAQRYVLDAVDVAYATDPMMQRRYPDAPIRESSPVIDFDLADLRRASADPFDEGPVRLLFVGVFRPVKGLTHLLEGFARLRKTGNRDYRLRLVGDGKMRSEIEQRAAELGVSDAIEFTGFVGEKDELVEHYRASDVFVVSSLKESVPRVLYEAGSMGLPVVATRVGGIPALLTDRENALLVEPEDGDAIADAVEALAVDEELRDRVVEGLQSTIEWHLRTDPVEQRVELFEEVLDD